MTTLQSTNEFVRVSLYYLHIFFVELLACIVGFQIRRGRPLLIMAVPHIVCGDCANLELLLLSREAMYNEYQFWFGRWRMRRYEEVMEQ